MTTHITDEMVELGARALLSQRLRETNANNFDWEDENWPSFSDEARACLEASVVVSEASAWEILRPRITGFGKDHGDDHFDDSCERCALIVELDAAFSLARETASEHSAGDDITLPNNPKPNPGGGG